MVLLLKNIDAEHGDVIFRSLYFYILISMIYEVTDVSVVKLSIVLSFLLTSRRASLIDRLMLLKAIQIYKCSYTVFLKNSKTCKGPLALSQ